MTMFDNPESTLIVFLAVAFLVWALRKPPPPKKPDEFEPMLYRRKE